MYEHAERNVWASEKGIQKAEDEKFFFFFKIVWDFFLNTFLEFFFSWIAFSLKIKYLYSQSYQT